MKNTERVNPFTFLTFYKEEEAMDPSSVLRSGEIRSFRV